jgi:hypothetical protein
MFHPKMLSMLPTWFVSRSDDGKEICTGTIGGLLSFWNTEDAKLKYEIDGRRDIGWR